MYSYSKHAVVLAVNESAKASHVTSLMMALLTRNLILWLFSVNLELPK